MLRVKNGEQNENFKKCLDQLIMIKHDVWRSNRCSTSLPGGKQVDGLPPALHLKEDLANPIFP